MRTRSPHGLEINVGFCLEGNGLLEFSAGSVTRVGQTWGGSSTPELVVWRGRVNRQTKPPVRGGSKMGQTRGACLFRPLFGYRLDELDWLL